MHARRLAAALVAAAASVAAQTDKWVATWTCAPQLTEVANNPPAPLAGSVVRQVVHVSAGGTRERVQFSNLFGNGPLTIVAAHVAACDAATLDSTIDVRTDAALEFGGAASVTLAAGAVVWSDALAFTLPPLSNLSVTTAFGAAPTGVNGHPGSRTTSYQVTGSADVSAPAMPAARTADHWYIMTGVDVAGGAAAQAVVVIGDSITDGRGSTTNKNDRWTDALSRRLLAAAGGVANASLVNQGIGGNAVTSGGLGPTALARFARDVLGQSAVTHVIVFEGVNDIGGGVAAAPITAAFASMIAQAHARGLRIYGATVRTAREWGRRARVGCIASPTMTP